MTNCECDVLCEFDAWLTAINLSKVKSPYGCRYVKKYKPHIYLKKGRYVCVILHFSEVNSRLHYKMALDYVRRQNDLRTTELAV